MKYNILASLILSLLLFVTACQKCASSEEYYPLPPKPKTYLPQELNQMYELVDSSSYLLKRSLFPWDLNEALLPTANRYGDVEIKEYVWKTSSKGILVVWYCEDADTLKVIYKSSSFE